MFSKIDAYLQVVELHRALGFSCGRVQMLPALPENLNLCLLFYRVIVYSAWGI